MLLSVLVPVYNVEPFLNRCLNTLVELPFRDYEIVLVDDGSTDSSGKLCDEWRRKYNYVKVIHQENQGLVASRNVGLAVAEGKYVSFVDSDDWIDRGFLPGLVADLEAHCDADIAVGTIVRNMQEGLDMPFMSRATGVISRERAIEAMIKKEGMHWYLCGKVFRRELFQRVTMDTRVTIFEDLDRIWPVAMRARNFFFDSKYAYHYFVNIEGLTEKRCDLNIASWRVFRRVLMSGYEGTAKKELVNYYVQLFLRHTLEMYFVDSKRFRKVIEEYIWELKDTLLKSEVQQNVLSERAYQQVSFNYESCIDFYDNIFKNVKSILEMVRKNFPRMFIYGTGVVAQYIWEVMEDMHICPDGFIVSDGQPKKNVFMGQEVHYFSEINLSSDVAFVLALSGNAERKVREVFNGMHKSAAGKLNVFSLDFPPIIF